MKKILIMLMNMFNVPANEHNLTLKNAKSFLQAKWRKLLNKMDPYVIIDSKEYFGFPLHKQEQVVWRSNVLITHPQAKQCLKNNQCPCECTTSDVIMADEACMNECFPDMMEAAQWEEFKQKEGITIDVEHFNIIKNDNI